MKFRAGMCLIAAALSACGDGVSGVGGATAGEAPLGGAGAAGHGGTGGEASTGSGAAGGAELGGGGSGGKAEGPCFAVEEGGPASSSVQSQGDCRLLVCVDDAPTPLNDDTDIPPDDGAECTLEACLGGLPSATIDTGAPCGAAGVCSASGVCVECLEATDCIGNPAGELCDSDNKCVTCLSSLDCTTPDAPACNAGECVECEYASQCAAGDCGIVSCVDNSCVVDLMPAGAAPLACFPYFCDGTTSECSTTCFSDDDCAGQTCDDGECAAASACDIEWVAVHAPSCALGPPYQPFVNFVGIDWSGNVYTDTVSPQPGGIMLWDAVKRSSGGQVADSWGGSDGLHNSCGTVLGPLGGVGRSCWYSYQAARSVSFQSIEYGWGDSLSVFGLGSTVSGGGTIDGANNVFFDAVGNDGMGNITAKLSVHDIAGNVMATATAQVPTAPPQILPAGFDSSLLTQLSSSDVKIDWSGNVSLAGTAMGDVDLGGGALVALGALDVVAARFDANGQHQWSHRFAASGTTASLVFNSFGAVDGSVIVTGDFASADFGFEPMAQSGADKFVVKISNDGQPACSRAVTGSAVAGPAGEIILLRNGSPLIVDGMSLGTLPTCAGLVTAKLHP